MVEDEEGEDEVLAATLLLPPCRLLLSVSEESWRPLAVLVVTGVVCTSSFFLKTETSRSNLRVKQSKCPTRLRYLLLL